MSTSESDDWQAGDVVEPSSLTIFQQNIMLVLADDGQNYGLGIKRELEDHYGKEVNHGRLYPNIDDLVRDGLISKSQKDRRTNNYSLTPKGRRLVRRDAQRRYNIADGMGRESDAE